MFFVCCVLIITPFIEKWLRASYRYSIYRKYRYQHIDTITGIPIGAFSIRIDIILTVVLWSRLDQGGSSTELFTKDIKRHFLYLIRKAAYRLRLRCVNWQSKQTGPLSLPARDCWHQEGPVYKASLVAVIVIAVPLVDVAAGIITLPMDSHACQEFHAVANFRWVLHKRSSFVVVLTWFTYGYSCPSMANMQLSSEVMNHALPWHRRWGGQHGLSQGLWSLMSEEEVRQNVGFWVRQSVQIKEWAWLRISYKNHMNSDDWSLDLIAWASRVLLDDTLTVLSAMIYTNNWHLGLGDTSIQVYHHVTWINSVSCRIWEIRSSVFNCWHSPNVGSSSVKFQISWKKKKNNATQ